MNIGLIAQHRTKDPNLYAFLSQLLDSVQYQGSSLQQITKGIPFITGPNSVSNLSIFIEPYVSKNNNLNNLIAISFNPPSDSNWENALIYVSGYLGNSQYVYITESNKSPVSFLMQMTGENVTFQIVSQNANGETNLGSAPTITITLSKVQNAPVPPSISSYLKGNATGYSFSFNVESGLLQNVIQVYKIYRNTVNNSSTASVIKVIPSSGNLGTVYEFKDQVDSTSQLYYWVSVVDTSGNESTLTAAYNGASYDNSLGTVPMKQSQILNVVGNLTSTGSYGMDSISSFATSSYVGSPINLTYATWVEVFSISFTPNGNNVLVVADCEFDNQSSTSTYVNTYLQRNASQIGNQFPPTQVPFKAAGEYAGVSCVRPDFNAGNSAVTYSLWAYLQNNISLMFVNGVTITAMNIKA